MQAKSQWLTHENNERGICNVKRHLAVKQVFKQADQKQENADSWKQLYNYSSKRGKGVFCNDVFFSQKWLFDIINQLLFSMFLQSM